MSDPAEITEVGKSGAPSGMVPVLTAAAFLIFAQAFMIAPILPELAHVFDTSVGLVGLAVPAYLIPYGIASLVWGPLADRVDRRSVIITCLVLFAVVTGATAAAGGEASFVAARVAAGVVASGVILVGLALIGDLVPYERRGHALGWLFGGMAGGMAVGSTVGALGEPVVGWRGLFIITAIFGAVIALLAAARVPKRVKVPDPMTSRAVVAVYFSLLRDRRARRTYGFVGFNAALHSGIYTWLGLYLQRRFGLGPIGVGLALLGYGIPGFVFGPAIGRAADRYGRARLIPAGLLVGAAAAFALSSPIPLAAAAGAITVLSLGYDLTQPLLAGIVTDLSEHLGQAVALMAVILFSCFGLGSLIFQAALSLGFTAAFTLFGVAAVLAAMLAFPSFSQER
ncbi:MAG: MFS transporter [Microthrixaceae bacterium]